jgi:hypothetical protein
VSEQLAQEHNRKQPYSTSLEAWDNAATGFPDKAFDAAVSLDVLMFSEAQRKHSARAKAHGQAFLVEHLRVPTLLPRLRGLCLYGAAQFAIASGGCP